MLREVSQLWLNVLEKNKGETRDMAVWAIGNVAADCNSCRKEVIY